MAALVIQDYKVKTLPDIGVPHSRYYTPNGNGTDVDQYITDKYGNFRKVTTAGLGSLAYSEVNEPLNGVINGSNASFTTTYDFRITSVIVYINGIKQKKPDFYNTIGTNIITFADSPEVGDLLEINYVKL